jgi:hypothetical protein
MSSQAGIRKMPLLLIFSVRRLGREFYFFVVIHIGGDWGRNPNQNLPYPKTIGVCVAMQDMRVNLPFT